MNWRARVIENLQRGYAFANRHGALQHPFARRLFARAYFLYKRVVEDPFDGLARRYPHLFRGGHVLDVGANIGYTAYVFARAVSPGFKVFAFEPERDNFALLCDTMARRALSGIVEPIQAAVGAGEGSVGLWRNAAHHADHRVVTETFQGGQSRLEIESVRQLSLDGFARARNIADAVRFIKIDVQGYEPAVLEGAGETLRRSEQAAIAIEYMPEAMRAMGFDPEAPLARLRAAGFVPTIIGPRGQLEPFGGLADRLAARGYVDLLCTRERLIP